MVIIKFFTIFAIFNTEISFFVKLYRLQVWQQDKYLQDSWHLVCQPQNKYLKYFLFHFEISTYFSHYFFNLDYFHFFVLQSFDQIYKEDICER